MPQKESIVKFFVVKNSQQISFKSIGGWGSAASLTWELNEPNVRKCHTF